MKHHGRAMRSVHIAIGYGIVAVAAVCGTEGAAFAQGGFTGPGWYQISNLQSGRSLALAPDLRAVVQMMPRDSEDQAWLIEPAQGGLVFIRTGITGNALQPTSGERSAPVVAAPFDGQPGQQWRIQPGKDGNALIVNYFGRVLDIPDGAPRDGVGLQIYDNNGDSNQRFTLRPMNGEFGNRWRRPPETARIVNCSSDDGRRRYCDVDQRGSVRMVRQLSGRPCREGETWGRDDRGVWVDRGCRAEFEIVGRPPMDQGRPDRNREPDRGAGANIVRCLSEGRGRTYCEADTRGGVRLVRQLEGPGCRQGETWGFDRGGIWVERGCRAEFELTRR
jgi:hypothetical protein